MKATPTILINETQTEDNTMRKQITESITRMTKEDKEDVLTTLGLPPMPKGTLKLRAFEDEVIAEYVLQY